MLFPRVTLYIGAVLFCFACRYLYPLRVHNYVSYNRYHLWLGGKLNL